MLVNMSKGVWWCSTVMMSLTCFPSPVTAFLPPLKCPKKSPATDTTTSFKSVFYQRAMTFQVDLPPDEDLSEILQVAIHASKAAGDIIVGNAGGAEVAERKANTRDLLTLIDPMCEKIMIFWEKKMFLPEKKRRKMHLMHSSKNLMIGSGS
mmetsp:Transcript_42132/g.127827  ORF Transcript_42132/g.127827 Transcript_42132/m.127827 type:complete len:151 (-) Transcript_42132:717-1169(-)